MNPEDNRRLSVYPHVEVEPTANVCPSGPSRDAGDQGRDGRVIWAGSRSEPARQGRGRGRSFDSGHGNGPPAHPRKGPPASMAQSCRDAMTAGTPPALRQPRPNDPSPGIGAYEEEGGGKSASDSPRLRVSDRRSCPRSACDGPSIELEREATQATRKPAAYTDVTLWPAAMVYTESFMGGMAEAAGELLMGEYLAQVPGSSRLLALLAGRAAASGYDPPGRLLAIVPENPPSRSFFLAMLIVLGATWVACVIRAIRGTRRSVWTEQTKRAIFGVVTLPIPAAIFAAGTFHHY